MGSFLVVSLVASVVLTVVLNLAIRLFPGSFDRGARWLQHHEGARDAGREPGRVRVYAPWRAMLIASLVLTVVLNVLLRLR